MIMDSLVQQLQSMEMRLHRTQQAKSQLENAFKVLVEQSASESSRLASLLHSAEEEIVRLKYRTVQEVNADRHSVPVHQGSVPAHHGSVPAVHPGAFSQHKKQPACPSAKVVSQTIAHTDLINLEENENIPPVPDLVGDELASINSEPEPPGPSHTSLPDLSLSRFISDSRARSISSSENKPAGPTSSFHQSPLSPEHLHQKKPQIHISHLPPNLARPPPQPNHHHRAPIPRADPLSPDFFTYGIRYIPAPHTPNIHRRTLLTNIPPSATAEHILAAIRGAPVLSLDLAPSIPPHTCPTAVVRFPSEHAARSYTTFITTHDIRICGHRLAARVLATPTYPLCQAQERMLSWQTRCVLVRGLAEGVGMTRILGELEREVRGVRIERAGFVDCDVLRVDFCSVWGADRARGVFRRRKCKVEFVRDPCAGALGELLLARSEDKIVDDEGRAGVGGVVERGEAARLEERGGNGVVLPGSDGMVAGPGPFLPAGEMLKLGTGCSGAGSNGMASEAGDVRTESKETLGAEYTRAESNHTTSATRDTQLDIKHPSINSTNNEPTMETLIQGMYKAKQPVCHSIKVFNPDELDISDL